MSSSSLDEKEKEWRLNDQEVAANSTKEYEPIVTEPLEAVGTEKELGANGDKQNSRKNLSRLQSGTSGISEFSEDTSDARSSTIAQRKKWYKRMNPLKWGPKPPVPEKREISPEYGASFLSLFTFQWMGPIMTVSNAFSLLFIPSISLFFLKKKSNSSPKKLFVPFHDLQKTCGLNVLKFS